MNIRQEITSGKTEPGFCITGPVFLCQSMQEKLPVASSLYLFKKIRNRHKQANLSVVCMKTG